MLRELHLRDLYSKRCIILYNLSLITVYGWREPFPINVTKGQELNLTVGYNKGSPNLRRGFRITYNDNGKICSLFVQASFK